MNQKIIDQFNEMYRLGTAIREKGFAKGKELAERGDKEEIEEFEKKLMQEFIEASRRTMSGMGVSLFMEAYLEGKRTIIPDAPDPFGI